MSSRQTQTEKKRKGGEPKDEEAKRPTKKPAPAGEETRKCSASGGRTVIDFERFVNEHIGSVWSRLMLESNKSGDEDIYLAEIDALKQKIFDILVETLKKEGVNPQDEIKRIQQQRDEETKRREAMLVKELQQLETQLGELRARNLEDRKELEKMIQEG